MKLNEDKAQTDINDPDSVELERIYILREFHSKGCGQFLINKALDITKSIQKKYIWLGVWENNFNAISFYKKNGFYKFSEHSFVMGDDIQIDLL